MKNAVYILSHKDLHYLKRAVFTAQHQLGLLKYEWHVVIIINTLSDSYYDEVKNTFKNYTIIKTLSNGKPGRGHNSVIQYHLNSEFDYGVLIDGDDALFPPALYQIEQMIDQGFDAVFQCFNDKIVHKTEFKDKNKHVQLAKNFFCYSLQKQENLTLKNTGSDSKVKNPWRNKTYNAITPGRLLLFNQSLKKITSSHKVDIFCENAKLYDDMKAFIMINDYGLRHIINVGCCFNPNIYCYNSLNNGSATKQFIPNKRDQTMIHKREHIFFKNACAKFKRFKESRYDKTLTLIKYLEVSEPENWTSEHRFKFEIENFLNFEVMHTVIKLCKHIENKKLKKAICLYERLKEYYGIDETENQMIVLKEKINSLKPKPENIEELEFDELLEDEINFY